MEKVEKNKPKRVRRSTGSFLGSHITPKNRWEFINGQKKLFIERYKPKEGEKVLEGEDLEKEALSFAKTLARMAQKEFKAYLKGDRSYKYKKASLPVMTEQFIKDSKSLKEIIKHELDEEE